MKLLGFILVTLSSAICGLSYYSAKSDRANDLRSFCIMLEMMQAELRDKLSPLPEIAISLSEKINGVAGSFLAVLSLNMSCIGEKGFEKIWCESLAVSKATIDEKEFEALASLAKVLGRYNLETQINAITDVLTFLHGRLREEDSKLPQLKKLSMSFSLSFGALLAIMLV